VRAVHNIQEDKIVEDMGGSMPRIYVALENKQGQEAQNDQKNTDSFEKRPRKKLVQCWGCEVNHLYRDFPQKG
jgi:hypothetical protein